MNRILCATLILATSLSASAADIITWIGKSSGSLFDITKWDPAPVSLNSNTEWKDSVRITNTVEFTESGTAYFWRNSYLSISGNSTVKFHARFWTAQEDYLTADKEAFVDVEKGSTLEASLMIGGINTCTFVKTGGGKIYGRNIGSAGNLFNKIRILEGTVELDGESNNALRAKTSIEIGSEAQVILNGANGIDTDTDIARALLKVDGLLDLTSKAQ
jgi:hypothetical protein